MASETPSLNGPEERTQFAVLLFTDICDSTALKAQHGALEYKKVAELHNRLFEQLAAEEKITLIKNSGDGYFARSTSVAAAVRFALRFQSGMRAMKWPGFPITTRVGIHAGEVADITTLGQADVLAPAADLVARVMGLAVGGQILLTRGPFDEARHFVRVHPAAESGGAPALTWLAHGPYLFKGCDEPVEVFEVGASESAPLVAPPDGEKAKRAIRPGEEETLGWRPASGLEVPGRVGWVLGDKIGEGGFGEVWLATQAMTKQRRVFKFCFDDERLRSFKRELTFFRLIRDALGERADIARLYDVKLDEPPFFLESEYAERGNLVEWCGKQGGPGAVPMERRIELMAQIAEAVAAAHSVGILHKDLKPQNVLMQVRAGAEDGPQITDFGIGALADKAALAEHGITAAGFTVNTLMSKGSGSSMTRLYAPPEQLTGKAFTVQGDVYALGVMLWQFVIGDFTRALAPGWERELKDDLLREDLAECLDGDPAHRLASANEFAQRLRTLEQRRASREAERRRAVANERRKRNARLALAVGALAAVIAVVLAFGFLRERDLRKRADEADRRRVAEERQRLADRKQFAPALVEAARLLIARRDFESARVSVEQAVEYDSSLVSALGLKTALLAEKEDYAGAVAVLVSSATADETLAKLRELCRGADADHRPDPKAMGEIFTAMELPSLAESYFARAGAHVEAAIAKIEAAWPGSAAKCSVLPSGKLQVKLSARLDVTDLSPLSGLPIEVLDLAGTRVKDLAPLKGMALTQIILQSTGVSDLTPLRGMPLTRVSIVETPVQALGPLSNAPLNELNASNSAVNNLAPLQKTPLTILRVQMCRIRTLEPLRGKSLVTLDASRTGIMDLAPLAGMPLTTLAIGQNPITSLEPLAGMKLKVLLVADTKVTDLAVLRGMPLVSLDIERTPVADVTPLAELTGGEQSLTLSFYPAKIQTGMNLLRGNPRIKAFKVKSEQVMDPDVFWKRYDARYFDDFGIPPAGK